MVLGAQGKSLPGLGSVILVGIERVGRGSLLWSLDFWSHTGTSNDPGEETQI